MKDFCLARTLSSTRLMWLVELGLRHFSGLAEIHLFLARSLVDCFWSRDSVFERKPIQALTLAPTMIWLIGWKRIPCRTFFESTFLRCWKPIKLIKPRERNIYRFMLFYNCKTYIYIIYIYIYNIYIYIIYIYIYIYNIYIYILYTIYIYI